MQETWVAQTTQYVVGDLLYVMVGHGGTAREYAGVGFVVRKDVRKLITGFNLGPGGIIMTMGLDFAPRRISLITACVPQSRRDEEERAGIMEALGKEIGECQRKGAVLVMGDFNARIHARLNDEGDVLGPQIFGGGVEVLRSTVWEQGGRTNRELLMEMRVAQGMKVMNTWFEKPDARKVTHRAPCVERLPKGGGLGPGGICRIGFVPGPLQVGGDGERRRVGYLGQPKHGSLPPGSHAGAEAEGGEE